jgi:hypothetical protein
VKAPWIFDDMSPAQIAGKLDVIGAAYAEYGVVLFPRLLKQDPLLSGFIGSVRYLFARILAKHGEKVASHEDLGDLLVRLRRVAPLEGRAIADMGTQPNKLVEANRLKYSDLVLQLLGAAFGPDAILATPHSGDTLHLFMPGEEFHKYNLPIHQDYQYLMQSPTQATLYLGMSTPHEGVGGLEFWPGSHKLGVLQSDRNEHGSFRVIQGERVLKDLEMVEYFWDVGDIALFHSLLCHRSIPNRTPDRGRVVQLFRFSDLRDPVSESFQWRSTVYERRSVKFEEVHPDLFAA